MAPDQRAPDARRMSAQEWVDAVFVGLCVTGALIVTILFFRKSD